MSVQPDRLDILLRLLDDAAFAAEQIANEYLTDTQARDIFNREKNIDGSLSSIRYMRLRGIINELRDTDEAFDTTSLKKASPILLMKNPTVASILEEVSRAGKMVSHKRRAETFRGLTEVFVELGYFRAHTGRFSSPSSGKGLNLHNCPKHDKEIAQPIRQTFMCPEGHVFVRADLANAEYRMEGWLTHCPTVVEMFDDQALDSLGQKLYEEANRFADPYVNAWKKMTGMVIAKELGNYAIRQVSKSAVLGLGFCMSPMGYARVLIDTIARCRKFCKPGREPDVTEESLKILAIENKWGPAPRKISKRIQMKLRCSEIVITAAFNIHKAFNLAHPEFGMTAQWLVNVVSSIARIPGNRPEDQDRAKRLIDRCFTLPNAPDRDRIDLLIDTDPLCQYPTVRVKAGPWPATVCWREPHARPVAFGGNGEGLKSQLTIRKANGFAKPFTKQLAIENVTQAAARNALCRGLLELERRGYSDYIHVHDEVLLMVPAQRDRILHARETLIDVLGPKNKQPYDWALMIKPEEVAVTRSLWEDEDDIAPRWEKILAGAQDALVGLP
jgi:hypothetical protein